MRIRAAVVERSIGELLIGPPKSKAGRRVVGIPGAIIPALQEHLAMFARGIRVRLSSLESRAACYAAATSTRCRHALCGEVNRG